MTSRRSAARRLRRRWLNAADRNVVLKVGLFAIRDLAWGLRLRTGVLSTECGATHERLSLAALVPHVVSVFAAYHEGLGGQGFRAVAADGVELFVLARRMAGAGEGGFAPGVPVTRIWTPFPRVHILEERSIRNLVISLCFSVGCLALLVARRRRYDLVHFHGASVPLLLCLPFLKLLGKKVVAKVAAANLGTEAGSLAGRYGRLGDLLARLARRVDAFVAISEEIRQGLLADGVAPGKIHRIDNFVDTETFRPSAPGEKDRLKERFGYRGQILVLYAGRLVPRKGVDHLLRAWTRVAPAHPDARLLLLGEGPLRQELEALARALGAVNTARFGGGVDNVAEYLRAADLFVLPSLQEGMPNALLEAMATGVRCVATRIGGVVDVVGEGHSVVLVPPAHPGALAGALGLCLGGVDRCEARGLAGLGVIRSRFDLAARTRAYRDLYEKAVELEH